MIRASAPAQPPSVRAQLATGIYLVTDPAMTMAAAGRPPRPESDRIALVDAWHQEAIARTVQVIHEVSAAGVAVVQLRWKNVDAGYFLQLARAAAELEDAPQLIINDRIDVFQVARAQGVALTGVHIGQRDCPPQAVRALLGPTPLLGYSVNSVAEARAAAHLPGIDSLGAGVLRHTSTKDPGYPALGLQGLAEIAHRSPWPITAIGGITSADIADLRRAGLASIAVVSAILTAPSPAVAARELVTQWESHSPDGD